MSYCNNSNSPIDLISTNVNENSCDDFCEYSFNYSKSSLNGFNKNTHLEFKLQNEKSEIKFGSIDYTLEKILLFKKSPHTLNGNNKNAELVLIHNNNKSPQQKLVVCILISAANQEDNDLDFIIKKMAELAPTSNNETTIRYPSFSLNNIVPKKNYFYYKGNLFYEKNKSSLCYDPDSTPKPSPEDFLHHIIVFDHVIYINEKSIELLNSLLSDHNITIKNSITQDEIFYSKNKAILGVGNFGEDDIYIECKPTGQDDEKVIPVDVDVDTNDKFKFLKDYLKKTFWFAKSYGKEILGSFVGAIIIYIILKINIQ